MVKNLQRCASTYYKEMPCASTIGADVSEKLFDNDFDIVCKSFYLSDNIGDNLYSTWFNSKCINVFNKTHCGNGGTTGFINYARKHFKGLLILVPNVSICKSKEEDYEGCDDVCCVYGGCEKIMKDACVVIATYDQFHKMMKELNDYGIDYNDDWTTRLWSGRTILIDEYHKITDECSFRDVCYDVTKLIKEQNKGVILMSATPHWGYIDFLKEYTKKEIKTYTVRYVDEEELLIEKGTPRCIQIYDVRKKIADIISKMYRSPKNKQIVVFYNNRDGVKKIIQKLGKKDVEVLCSQEHSDDFGEFYSDIFCEEKKLHFMTSAYFAGCDINTHIDACVIIGSKSHSFLSYNNREIKQMIGRFRKGCQGVHLFYNGKVQDVWDYNENKTRYDECMNRLQEMGSNWMITDEGIVLKQKSLMLKDRLGSTAKWSNIESLKKMLTEVGYVVRECKVGDFESLCAARKLSSKETKERIIGGYDVSWEENTMAGSYKAYFERYGAEALRAASARDVKDWYKIRKNVGDENDDLSLMLPDELFDIVGLEEGYYSGSYLMSCLKYVGVKCNHKELPLRFRETFNACAVLLSIGKKDHKREKYLVYKTNKGDFVEESLYNESSTKNPLLGIRPLISFNHKKTLDGHLLCKTFLLETSIFQSLKGIGLYDWVMEDKEHRLPMVKENETQNKKWKSIKNYRQSKISEMIKYTNEEYRHTIKEMEYVNILICDIDSGLSFEDFKKKYGKHKWTAYPTLNNISKDWSKYRVIVYLDQAIELKGEHNLKVLKILRTMFCSFEDPNHQMASYINQEDWEQRYENEGELYHIEQSLVDNLMLRIKNFKEYKNTAFVKKENLSADTPLISFEEAKEHFERSFKSGDGTRHRALFIVKNRLSDTDRTLFESWLISNYPSYLTKWKSHKVV